MDCKNPGCNLAVLSFAQTCWFHLENQQDYRNLIIKKAEEGESFIEANFANVDFSNLELKEVSFRAAGFSHADLSNAILWHCDFQDTNLTGANLSFADISSAHFTNAQLFKANLSSARCWNTDFTSANLVEANLSAADFLNSKMFNTRLWHAIITNAKSLSQSNFENDDLKLKIECSVCEKRFHEARDTYTSLKQYFLSKGSYEDVHWASFKEMSMQRMIFLQNKDVRYIPSLFASLTSGYAEKPWRVVGSSFLIIFLYALVYYLSDAVIYSSMIAYKPSFWDTFYYSIVTFTTLGYGDFIPKANSAFRFLAGSEAFIGAFMVGLFVFTLARRYSAR